MTKKVVLDIETIPDAGAAARAGFKETDAFPPFPLHAIACVSLLIVDQDGMAPPTFSIQSFSREQMSERGIIASVERAAVYGEHLGATDPNIRFLPKSGNEL